MSTMNKVGRDNPLFNNTLALSNVIYQLNTFSYLEWMGKTLQGRFKPTHPEKYKGDPTNIIFRSSWEKMFMRWCDDNKAVKSWQSEEKAIWYYNPVTKKNARYFPDFVVNIEKDGKIIKKKEKSIKVNKMGFNSFIFTLAHKFSFIYGIISVLIAISFGIIAGVIFRKIL